ncbi:MAG: class I SAM-dependent RNA methyltransferase [Verrucomicrobiota bacterium]
MTADAPRNFSPDPFPYHHQVELRVDRLTNLGAGVGRVNDWVVMVPYALPGELVRTRIYRNRPNFSEGDLIEVLEPSPDRVEPRCDLFGTCGGCQYQQLAYPAQLEWKQEQVREVFERIGGITETINLPKRSPKEFGYRSKITPHFQRWQDGGRFPIGFLKFGQRGRIVDVPHCPIATDAINEKLPEVRRISLTTPPKGKKRKGATLLLRDVMEGVETDAKALVTERVGNIVFQFKAGEFFQNNPFILPDFANYVGDQASKGSRYLIDAYCGSGLFSLTAASRFDRVVGIEVSAAAVTLADSNAALNRIKNAEFRAGEAEAIFTEVTDLPADETSVIIDPPRRGCDEQFLHQLIAYLPRRIVYVSCDPATQARDLRILTESAYRIEEIQPFDLFPQTRHIENVVTLSR